MVDVPLVKSADELFELAALPRSLYNIIELELGLPVVGTECGLVAAEMSGFQICKEIEMMVQPELHQSFQSPCTCKWFEVRCPPRLRAVIPSFDMRCVQKGRSQSDEDFHME